MLTPVNPLSARYVAICTGVVADGDFIADAACVAIGVLADGSETPVPEGGTFRTMEGDIGVSATLSHTYRISRFVKGTAEAVRAVRNAGGVVCAVINKGATNYTNCGPGVVSEVTVMGNNVESQPGGARVKFGAEEDFANEIYAFVNSPAAVEPVA